MTGRGLPPWRARPSGGFLAGAMQTALGVAGGMLVADALSNAFADGEEAVTGLAEEASATAEEAVSNAGAIDRNCRTARTKRPHDARFVELKGRGAPRGMQRMDPCARLCPGQRAVLRCCDIQMARGSSRTSTSLRGMFSTGSSRSTAPVRMALVSMLSCAALSALWTIVSPPSSFTARSPSVPSWPLPESRMQTAFPPQASARETKKASIGARRANLGRAPLHP